MTQNEIDIIKELIENSKDCFELLYNIILELEGNNKECLYKDEYDLLSNEDLVDTVYYKINRLLNNCINAIFSDKKVPSVDELVNYFNDDFPLIKIKDNKLLIYLHFEIMDNINFNNFHNYMIDNDHKIPLKIMEFIPTDKLEYYIYCDANNLGIDRKSSKLNDLFKSFINNKIKSGEKNQINNLIHIILNGNFNCMLIRNLDCTIYKFVYHNEFETKNNNFYTFGEDNKKYIVFKNEKLFLIIDRLYSNYFKICNYEFKNNILKFNINYFSNIFHYEVNISNNTIHVV